ncbi:hypothetical protein ACHAXS_003134 [Conticribra weissflogii]
MASNIDNSNDSSNSDSDRNGISNSNSEKSAKRPRSQQRPSCRPPANSTYLAIGQDLFSVSEYVSSQYNYSLHQYISSQNHKNATNATNATNSSPINDPPSLASVVPSAFMVYTDLAHLEGLWDPTDYGSGIEYADGLSDLFPPRTDAGLQIGLYLNGTAGCTAVFTGRLDPQIRSLLAYLERSPASKIFLRIGYEFDNPSFGYGDDPSMYVLAFRKIVADCRRGLSDDALDKVLFVWHSWGAPLSEGLTLERFYPGDDYVDWMGVSIFQQFFPWSPYWGGTAKDVENLLAFAKRRKKPVMIAESTPFGGIELKEASMKAKAFMAGNVHDSYLDDPWERWFGKVIDLINTHDISMWCYINCDWESQPMWHDVGFGQTRLASNAYVMSKWHDLIVKNRVQNRRFLGAGSLENCGLSDDSHFSETDIATDDNLADSPTGRTFFSRGDIMSDTVVFILIPFLVVSGAFYIPYFFLGGHKSKYGISTKKERKPLLSNINSLSIRGGTAPFANINDNVAEDQAKK